VVFDVITGAAEALEPALKTAAMTKLDATTENKNLAGLAPTVPLLLRCIVDASGVELHRMAIQAQPPGNVVGPEFTAA
jgi:hypothetical protein